MLLHPSTVTDDMPPRLARPEVAASHDVVASDQSGALGAVGLGPFDIEERRDRSPSLLGMIVRPTVADQVSDSICSRTLRGGHTGLPAVRGCERRGGGRLLPAMRVADL